VGKHFPELSINNFPDVQSDCILLAQVSDLQGINKLIYDRLIHGSNVGREKWQQTD